MDAACLRLQGPLANFSDLLEEATCGPETASEAPLWRALVPSFIRGALYVFDLAFFERRMFAEAREHGAQVLMRLKKPVKVRSDRPAARPAPRSLVSGLLSLVHPHEEVRLGELRLAAVPQAFNSTRSSLRPMYR